MPSVSDTIGRICGPRPGRRPCPLNARRVVRLTAAGAFAGMPPSLKILALDCSSECCSAALLVDGEVRQRIERTTRHHSDLLLPMVRSLLAEAQWSLNRLDGIAAAMGPGSFTSLRIVASVAQGLAFGAGLPVAAVGTLDAIALGSGADRTLVCTDARMQEVYAAAFERQAGDVLMRQGPVVCAPRDLFLPEGSGWTGAGDGFARHAGALAERLGGHFGPILPDLASEARFVGALAMARFPEGFRDAPECLVPTYVRDKVALTMAER